MSSFIFDDSYPQKYLDEQYSSTKNLNMVVCIEGLETCFSMTPTYTYVRYGDPGVNYGAPGLVYGGLRLAGGVTTGLSLESNLVISQRLEPEQGRGAVSTMSLVFVDFLEYFSKLISPGQTLDDVLGNKLFKVYLGYQTQSFPEDYLVVFRGYASNTRAQSGKITIQLSDANLKRRSYVFNDQTTTLSAAVDSSQTNIPVVDTSGFSTLVMGPDGFYDPAVKTLIQVDDEVMDYDQNGIPNLTNFTVTRGALGSTPASHDADADVKQLIYLEDNCFTLALKIMLSGWNGPFATDVKAASVQNCLDYGTYPNAVRMPDGYDIVEELNVRPGDYCYITGSGGGNAGTYIIESIRSSEGENNNILFFTTNLAGVPENPASPNFRMAFRSKYDTLPVDCGAKLRPTEIDMQAWEDLRDTFYPDNIATMRFVFGEKQRAKELIEKEILLPTGSYSITRFGRLSVKVTLPPIAGQKIIVLNNTNVKDPAGITVERALNTRRFFNEISYAFDYDPFFREYLTTTKELDTDSLNIIGVSSTLPIQSLGLKSDLAAPDLIAKRGTYLLTRYKKAAYEIQEVKVNWGTGSLIEAGDTVVLDDNGKLQITNLNTGQRNLGAALMEVIDRQVDIKNGDVKLKLLSNIGYEVTDRFAVISPTSQIAATGSTADQIRIQDSYGELFPGDEGQKWQPIIGQNIRITKKDFSDGYTRRLVGFLDSDPFVMVLDLPLPLVPDFDWVVEVDDYPDTVNSYDNGLLKTLFCYQDPAVPVLAGISDTQFTVNIGEIGKFRVGNPVYTHDANFTTESAEASVSAINVNQITVGSSLGLTPATGDIVELIGFIDGGGPYRIL